MAGSCPECGTGYDNETATRLQPWPRPLVIFLRLGWPLIALALVVSAASIQEDIFLLFLGYASLFTVPVNSYFQVRSMLKASMPQRTRTTGIVAVLRALGTTVCVVFALVMLLPVVLLGACLVLATFGNGLMDW